MIQAQCLSVCVGDLEIDIYLEAWTISSTFCLDAIGLGSSLSTSSFPFPPDHVVSFYFLAS